MIAFGFFANVSPFPFDLVCLFFSFFCFCYVMSVINLTISLAITEGIPADSSQGIKMRWAHRITCLSWVGVPLVWCLAYCRLLSHRNEEILYQFLDFVIKAGVSCIIMHSSLRTFAERQQERFQADLHEERQRKIEALQEAARMKVLVDLN